MAILYLRDESGNFVPVPSLKGSDANVTAENIELALGYKPANDTTMQTVLNEINGINAAIGTGVIG